jgi:hypothetical protein
MSGGKPEWRDRPHFSVSVPVFGRAGSLAKVIGLPKLPLGLPVKMPYVASWLAT